MKREINNKIFILEGLFICIIIIFAVTYAIQTDTIFKNMMGEKILIDEEAYGDTKFDSSRLNLVPILDENIKKEKNHVIHIFFVIGGNQNNTVDNIIYDIALNDLEVDCDLISPYVKWKLIKNNEEISQGSLDYHFDTIENGRMVLTNIQQDLVKYNKNRVGYDRYDFYLWISDSCQDSDITKCINDKEQSHLMGKVLKGKIEVELYADEKRTIVRNPGKYLDFNTCIKNRNGVQ